MTLGGRARPNVPDRFRAGITRLRPEDHDDLAAFQARMFGPQARQLDQARVSWMFERNPFRSPDGPGLWICRRRDEIVGQQAEIPFELKVGACIRRAAWTIDLMVDPAWRIRGVGPALVAAQLEGCDLALGLTQSDAAIRSYLRGGWVDVGIVPVYLRPLDARRLLRVAPVADRLRPLAPVAGPVLRGVDAALAGGARIAGLRLEPIQRFDDRVEEVWERAAADYTVVSVRDAATVRYRLDDRPKADELMRYYLTRRGRTLGWVALRRHSRWGEPAAFVVDYLAPVRWVAPLLTLAGHAARRDGAVALVCRTLCARADRALHAAGFTRRGMEVAAPMRLMTHCTMSDDVCPVVGESGSWLLTAGDSDLA